MAGISGEDRSSLEKQLTKNRPVTAFLGGTVAAYGERGDVRKSGEKI